MNQDTLNYIFIGLSFALYIGIALKSRASSTKEYYTAGEVFPRWLTEWQQLLIGCQPQRLSRWQVLWPLADMQVLGF